MRTTTLALNAIIAVFFASFGAYTFVAQQHLEGLARDFVTEKSVQHSKVVVDLAEVSLDFPIVKQNLPAVQAAAIREEIAGYRKDSFAYIADLTQRQNLNPPPAMAKPFFGAIEAIKEEIREFYVTTLSALIRDLRIFSGTNLIAGVIAFAWAYRSKPQVRPSIVWLTILMFIAVLYCSSLYLDELTFFRILFRMQRGWFYPVLLCLVTVGLFREYGAIVSDTATSSTAATSNR